MFPKIATCGGQRIGGQAVRWTAVPRAMAAGTGSDSKGLLESRQSMAKSRFDERIRKLEEL